MRAIALCAASLSVLTRALPARADDASLAPDEVAAAEPPGPNARPNVLRDSIALDTAVWVSQRFGAAWPLVLSGQHRLVALPAGTLVGALAVPVATGTEARNGTGGGAAIGNPTATLTYALPGRVVTPFLGVRIAAPIASAGDERSDLVVERGAAALGYYDHHLWSVGYLPLALPFGVEIQPAPALRLRGTFTPLLYAAIEQWAETKPSMQGEIEIEGRSARGTGGGIALRAVAHGVFRSAADAPDDTQASIEPYFVYDGPVLVRAGIMFAMDEPLGFGEDNDFAIVAPHLTIGARLDAIRARRSEPRRAAQRPAYVGH